MIIDVLCTNSGIKLVCIPAQPTKPTLSSGAHESAYGCTLVQDENMVETSYLTTCVWLSTRESTCGCTLAQFLGHGQNLASATRDMCAHAWSAYGCTQVHFIDLV